MAILSILLTTIIIIASILIVLIVLVQRPKQEGLGAAFGGGAFDSALGAHTTDVLQKITTYLGVIFFISAVGLAMVKARQFNPSSGDLLEDVSSMDEKNKELLETTPSITAPPVDMNATPAPVIVDEPAAITTEPAAVTTDSTTPAEAATDTPVTDAIKKALESDVVEDIKDAAKGGGE